MVPFHLKKNHILKHANRRHFLDSPAISSRHFFETSSTFAIFFVTSSSCNYSIS